MAQKISRRDFLKLASGTSLFGLGVLASGCASEAKDEGGDGWMPDQYQGRGDFPAHLKGRVAISPRNPSIMRDDEKCILCGQCIEACHNVIGVHGYYPLPLKDETACIGCGQCTMWCPTGAIHERPAIDQVEAALADDTKFVVVQTAPATKVSLGEEFGMAPGSIVGGKQVAALKALGFDAVFDTCMSADMTIMEEASEALMRLTQKKDELPHFTSCCPGWVRFCELFYPDLMKHLSTCKSPAEMMGATVKTYYAEKKGLDPKDIVSVSICGIRFHPRRKHGRRPHLRRDGRRRGGFRALALLLRDASGAAGRPPGVAARARPDGRQGSAGDRAGRRHGTRRHRQRHGGRAPDPRSDSQRRD